jgi:hypothetical protein
LLNNNAALLQAGLTSNTFPALLAPSCISPVDGKTRALKILPSSDHTLRATKFSPKTLFNCLGQSSSPAGVLRNSNEPLRSSVV